MMGGASSTTGATQGARPSGVQQDGKSMASQKFDALFGGAGAASTEEPKDKVELDQLLADSLSPSGKPD